MNLSEYKIYVDKLCTMSNNYYLYDENYIKNKYNISNYDKFRKYFKKYHNDKLIFNSEKAERFFIKVMNLDSHYMKKKYADLQAQIIIDFFIKRNDCHFNECEEFNKLNVTKLHSAECKCKIKVKSVVNLSINALIFILMEYNLSSSNTTVNTTVNTNNNMLHFYIKPEYKEEKSVQNTQIVKLYNSKSNKKIIECINKIENVKNNLGLNNGDTIYQLTETKPTIKILDTIVQMENINIPCKNNEIINTLLVTNEQNSETNNNISLKSVNTKKYDEQFISESINLNETEDCQIQKNKIFIKNNLLNDIKESNETNCDMSDDKRLNNLTQYAFNNICQKNNDERQFKIDYIQSDSSENSYDSNDSIDSNNKILINSC